MSRTDFFAGFAMHRDSKGYYRAIREFEKDGKPLTQDGPPAGC